MDFLPPAPESLIKKIDWKDSIKTFPKPLKKIDIEIWNLIFSHLQPKDHCQAALTCKAFRIVSGWFFYKYKEEILKCLSIIFFQLRINLKVKKDEFWKTKNFAQFLLDGPQNISELKVNILDNYSPKKSKFSLKSKQIINKINSSISSLTVSKGNNEIVFESSEVLKDILEGIEGVMFTQKNQLLIFDLIPKSEIDILPGCQYVFSKAKFPFNLIYPYSPENPLRIKTSLANKKIKILTLSKGTFNHPEIINEIQNNLKSSHISWIGVSHIPYTQKKTNDFMYQLLELMRYLPNSCDYLRLSQTGIDDKDLEELAKNIQNYVHLSGFIFTYETKLTEKGFFTLAETMGELDKGFMVVLEYQDIYLKKIEKAIEKFRSYPNVHFIIENMA